LSSCAFIAWYIDIHAVTSMSIGSPPAPKMFEGRSPH
jgi:hypothetical protein